MKRILTVLLMTLGVIFLILIVIGAYMVIVDPYNIRPFLFPSAAEQPLQNDEIPADSSSGTTSDEHPTLSPAQEEALESFGVDPAGVPTEITPELEACFVEVLGEARIDEIKAGDLPTTAELFKARVCLE